MAQSSTDKQIIGAYRKAVADLRAHAASLGDGTGAGGSGGNVEVEGAEFLAPAAAALNARADELEDLIDALIDDSGEPVYP